MKCFDALVETLASHASQPTHLLVLKGATVRVYPEACTYPWVRTLMLEAVEENETLIATFPPVVDFSAPIGPLAPKCCGLWLGVLGSVMQPRGVLPNFAPVDVQQQFCLSDLLTLGTWVNTMQAELAAEGASTP